MREPVFTGAAVALATPFKNGSVDYEAIEKLIEFHALNKTDAIVACATTGEAPTLSDEEHLAVIKFVAEHVAGRMKVIAGTGSNDTAHAVELSQESERYGVDGFLLVTPYYNKTTQRGLIKHYTYIADRVNKPMIVYNVPGRTGMSIAADTYAELAKHPMINGTKEASGDMSLVVRTRKACPEDFCIWSGEDILTVPLISMGGKGVISTCANIIPDVMVKLSHLALEGNFVEAAGLQAEYSRLMDLLFCETNPIPIKAAMEMMGLCGGELRLPLYEMAESNREKLKAEMVKLGLLK